MTRRCQASRGRSSVAWTCLALTLATVAVPSPAPVQAQALQVQRIEDWANPTPTTAAVVEQSPAITFLFNQADDAISRADWKLAIDSLQRIIEERSAGLVTRDTSAGGGVVVYESSRRLALRRLGGLPPAGLEAYRLLYDGRAKGLLNRALRDNDLGGLRDVVHRYLLTRHGDDAADALASRALDEGRPAEALAVLTDVRELVPDADVPPARLAGKLTAAYLALGRQDEAGRTLADLRQHGQGTAEDWLAYLTPEVVRPMGGEGEGAGAAWAMSGGGPRRTGRMAAVTPFLEQRSPWRYALPGGVTDVWQRVFQDDPSRPPRVPQVQMVAAEDRVFLRLNEGCAALDADTLEELWRSESPGETVAARQRERFQRMARTRFGLNAEVTTVEDRLIAEIALAGPLLLTLEATDAGVQYDEQGVMFRQGGVLLNRLQLDYLADWSNRLIAFDAGTGALRWQQGRTFDSDDPLGAARFCGLPIQVEGTLWLPLWDRGDLFAAALDPADGTLQERILLCSIDQSVGTAPGPLQIAYADGLLFIPTVHGGVFCVDLASRTLRWAATWPRPAAWSAYDAGTQPSAFGLVAGSALVTYGTDDASVRAFDVSSGAPLWTFPRLRSPAPIGADAERVWMAGREIVCLSAKDGSKLWGHRVEGVPTGLPAISGSHVYVPTEDGLTVLDAATGNALPPMALPEGESPLGNLICLGTALYSVDSGVVRRFVDLEAGYDRLVASWTDARGDARVGVRLAWAELLRGEPARALEILDAVSPGDAATDARLERELARARMETLLQLAAAGAGDPLELLAQAERCAATPQDRFRVKLKMADRLAAVGRSADAYQALWQLSGEAPDDQAAPLSDWVHGRATLLIADRLAELQERAGPAALGALRAPLREEAQTLAAQLDDAATRDEARRRLLVMAELDGDGPMAGEVLLRLGEWELRRRRYEQAEWYLRRCAARATDDPPAMRALMRLCELYAGEDVALADPLAQRLDDLDRRFGPRPLVHDEGQTETRTVSAWVAAQRRVVSEDGSGALASGSLLATPISAQGWTPDRRQPVPRLVELAGTPHERPTSFLVYPGDGALYAMDAVTGEPIWAASLAASEEESDWGEPEFRARQGPLPPRRVACDGQTLVVADTAGLRAVGIVSGKLLWERPFARAVAEEELTDLDYAIAARDGVVAAAMDLDRLVLLRGLDGSLIWERTLRGSPADMIWLTPGHVLVSDLDQRQVQIFDLADGTAVGQAVFAPSAGHQSVRLVVGDSVLCGPSTASDFRGVVGIDISSAKARWKVPVDADYFELFVAGERHVGVGADDGRVWMIDIESGEVLFERRAPSFAYVQDGRLIGPTLVLLRSANVEGQTRHVMVGMDVATGSVVWERSDLAHPAVIDGRLNVVDDTLLMFLERPLGDRRGSATLLALVDPATGKDLGEPTEVFRAGSRDRLNGDVVITDTSVIIGTTSDIRAYTIRDVAGTSPR